MRLHYDGEAPVIDTGRLVLRGPDFDDFPVYARMWADPAVTKDISGAALSEEDAWTRFLRNAGLWPLMGYGYWHVFDKESGAFAGQVGFADFRRDIAPSLAGAPEIGWVIAPAFQGRGYAAEAALAAVSWGECRFGAARMSCIISPGNRPSIRIAEKCGFRETARADYHGKEVVVFFREPE